MIRSTDMSPIVITSKGTLLITVLSKAGVAPARSSAGAMPALRDAYRVEKVVRTTEVKSDDVAVDDHRDAVYDVAVRIPNNRTQVLI